MLQTKLWTLARFVSLLFQPSHDLEHLYLENLAPKGNSWQLAFPLFLSGMNKPIYIANCDEFNRIDSKELEKRKRISI